MFKNFYAARNALDAALRDGKLALTSSECAVFRYLLEHTLYQPRDPKDYGFVNAIDGGVETIAQQTCLSARTVIRAVGSLEDKGLMGRWRRQVFAGGRKPDLIEMDWVKGVVGDTVAPTVADTVAPSYSFVEEGMEEAVTNGI